uniref:Putative secreted peptide n=1 Tax=Anopheles braziliensis TaxID=58242 RepID=A0A2M3ZP05_9DIPT
MNHAWGWCVLRSNGITWLLLLLLLHRFAVKVEESSSLSHTVHRVVVLCSVQSIVGERERITSLSPGARHAALDGKESSSAVLLCGTDLGCGGDAGSLKRIALRHRLCCKRRASVSRVWVSPCHLLCSCSFQEKGLDRR